MKHSFNWSDQNVFCLPIVAFQLFYNYPPHVEHVKCEGVILHTQTHIYIIHHVCTLISPCPYYLSLLKPNNHLSYFYYNTH